MLLQREPRRGHAGSVHLIVGNELREFLLGTVGPFSLYPPVIPILHDSETPRVTAHLAVLHDSAAQIWLEVNLDLLATVRTHHQKLRFQRMTAIIQPR